MKIGVLGTGDVGKALGRAFIATGSEVRMGSRTASNATAHEWAKEMGSKASVGTFADAAAFGEIAIIAVHGEAAENSIRLAGQKNFDGKVVIDVTNPLDFSKGFPPTLAAIPDGSAGERLQRLLPKARVVKAFNIVGNTLFYKPDLPGGPPDMFICGNDDAAKQAVTKILEGFGWGVIDIGAIQSSRYLEAMCMAWVLAASKLGTWTLAFKMLRK